MSFEEGFQTGGAAGALTAPQTCHEGAIQVLPLMLDFLVTPEVYDSTNAPVSIDFKWGARSNPPRYSNQNVIDEVGTGKTNLTTFFYMGVEYIVQHVEIASATHRNWIVPADNRVKNQEDILITFQAKDSSVAKQYAYILFVIPIIRNDTVVNESSYIRALLDSRPIEYIRSLVKGVEAGQTYSLRSCFPTSVNSLFAYYSICLNGLQEKYQTETAQVFVSTEGIPMLRTTMIDLLKKFSIIATEFPAPSPPFKNRFTAGINPKALKKEEFSRFVLTTNQLLNAAGYAATVQSSTRDTRRDDLNSYKCVPLNPDVNVEGGGIDIDVETGLPLKDVLETRDAEMRALGTTPTKSESISFNPGRLEKLMSSAIGIFMAILAGLGMILFISRRFGPVPPSPSESGPAGVETITIGAKIAQFTQSSATLAIIVLLTGFSGFLIGAMLQ